MATNKKVLTIILDGWGINKAYKGNAITLANIPTYNKLWAEAPHAQLACSGEDVGLPDGQMGTSEVNHMTIGAGRVIFQDLAKINQAIAQNTFATNPEFVAAFEHAKKNNSKLHIKGLYSPGGVHSHSSHIKALVLAAKAAGLTKIYLHIFTDGRDTKPKTALGYIADLEKFLAKQGVGEIATLGGRYFAMDRDHNWDRIDLAFNAMTKGEAEATFPTATAAIQASYDADITDEFIKPCLIQNSDSHQGIIEANDAVIFANFRSDRPRQLVERFIEQGPKNLYYVTMTQYSSKFDVHVAFAPVDVPQPLGEVLSTAGLKQLRIAETEKFAHLTFFMNCKKEEPYADEERIMFNSYSDVKTHDEKPQMRTPDIAKRIIKEITTEKFSAIFTNWCNADMVGHTGNIPATIKGIEAIDAALTKVLPVAQKHGYSVIITADHGNAEEMLDQYGDRLTAHTTYPVPFIVVDQTIETLQTDRGTTADVAPTILKLLEIEQPTVMTGKSLV